MDQTVKKIILGKIAEKQKLLDVSHQSLETLEKEKDDQRGILHDMEKRKALLERIKDYQEEIDSYKYYLSEIEAYASRRIPENSELLYGLPSGKKDALKNKKGLKNRSSISRMLGTSTFIIAFFGGILLSNFPVLAIALFSIAGVLLATELTVLLKTPTFSKEKVKEEYEKAIESTTREKSKKTKEYSFGVTGHMSKEMIGERMTKINRNISNRKEVASSLDELYEIEKGTQSTIEAQILGLKSLLEDQSFDNELETKGRQYTINPNKN